MTSVGLDVGVMWRLSEDLNVARRLAVHVQQQQQQHSHRSVASSMIYNGNSEFSASFLTQSVREYTRNRSYKTAIQFNGYVILGVVLLAVSELARRPADRQIQMCLDESDIGAEI